MRPCQWTVLVNRIKWNLILLKIKICLSVSWMLDLFQTTASSFIYLIIPSHVCTCERTDHGALGPAGHLTPHPWPPSAGQTLTLEQMDNGLHALSAPDHTLLFPALATAFPFTSRCPLFLFLHLPSPALDCLNSQKHLCFTFYVFFLFYNSPLELHPCWAHVFHVSMLCIYFYLLRFLSLSILHRPGRCFFLQSVCQHGYTAPGGILCCVNFHWLDISSRCFRIIPHPVTPFTTRWWDFVSVHSKECAKM